jgi:hypothetical protein
MMGAAALALDPERLLWRPNAKTIFIPPLSTYESISADLAREGADYTVTWSSYALPQFVDDSTMGSFMDITRTEVAVALQDLTNRAYQRRFSKHA